MKVAIYARVSTDKQESENQILQLNDYCMQKYSLEPVLYKDDAVSGRKTTLWERDKGKELLKDVKSKKIDLVVVWAIDRLTREGIDATRDYLNLLRSYDVKVVSYTEQFLNTDNDLIRNILIDVLAWVAKKEAEQLSNRTKAGLERVKLKGSKSGNPIGRKKTYTPEQEAKVKELSRVGRKYTEIAKELGMNAGSVNYILTKGIKILTGKNSNSKPVK